MTAREHYYAEALTETTTTSTSYSDQVSLTATLSSGADYWIIFSAEINQSTNATADAKVRLYNDTGAAMLRELNLEMKDQSATTGDYMSVSGIDKITGTGSSNTWSLEFAAETSTNTVRCRNASIFILKVGAADQYAESEGDSTSTSTSFTTKTTLTFTPASTGDYLLIASAALNLDTTGSEPNCRLANGGSYYGAMQLTNKDSTNYAPWNTAIKLNLAASSQTFTIEYSVTDGIGEGATIRHASILAIRLDAFANAYYAEDLTELSTTSTTFQDKVTLTQTPAARDHLVLAGGRTGAASTSDTALFRLTEAGSSVRAHQYEKPGGSAANARAWMAARSASLAASSTTWKTQVATRVSAAARLSDSFIAVLDLEEAGGGGATLSMVPRRGGASFNNLFSM